MIETPTRQAEFPIDPLFTRRWSPRAFTGEAMSAALLMRCLEAARWAPSAFNSQPWRFVYALPDTPAWAPIFGSLLEFNQVWVRRAGALVVVLSRTCAASMSGGAPRPIPTHSFDAGAAWANLALQATLAEWHAHAMAGYDPARLRAAIGAPEDVAIEAVVAIGRMGAPELLPDKLRARELPSVRLPLTALAAEGRYEFPA